MANVTIDNTTKTGFIKINMNDYYPNTIDEREHWIRISDDFQGMCIILCSGSEAVELHIAHEKTSMYFSHTALTGALIVDSVNGVSPTSINDLRDKILALV